MVLLVSLGAAPADADAASLTLDDDTVDVGTVLSGTVVDGPVDDGNRIVVSLDADGDSVYDNGEPQVRIPSTDSGTALSWSGLSTAGLAAGNYTVYAVEANNVKNRDTLSGATAAVRVVDPAPTISNFQVTNPGGEDVRVQFAADEPLSSISVSITGAETGTLSTPDFDETGSGPYTYVATYAATTPGTYTATLEHAIDGGGNDGATGESGSVTLTLDATLPDLLAAETGDADGDGTVDEVRLTFTEPVDDSSLAPGDLAVAGATETAVSTGSVVDDDAAVLSVSGLPGGDTSLTPQVVLRSKSVSDLAGNEGPQGATSKVSVDGAAPVILAATTANADDDDRIDRLNVTLSEGVVASTVDASDYDVGGTAYAGETVLGYDGGRHLLFGFDEGSTPDTGATPPLGYTRGSTVDPAGNPMANRTFAGTADGVPPAFELLVGNATADGFGLAVGLSEAGSATYVVVSNGAPAPSTTQVVLGRDAADSPAIRWGIIQVHTAGTNASAAIAGLAADEAYDVYAVAVDRSGNRREPPAQADVTTLPPPRTSDDGSGRPARRGTSVTARNEGADGVLIEVRNPRTSRPVKAPLGGVGSAGVVYRRVTFDFQTAVPRVAVRVVPGAREPADPALEGVHVIEYFTASRVDDGPSPFSTVTFELRVTPATLPAGVTLEDVTFFRFEAGAWNRLESRRGGETFTVTTAGFSSFAVGVEERPPPATTAPTTPTTDATPGMVPGTEPPKPPSTPGGPPPGTPPAQRAGNVAVALGAALSFILAFLLADWALYWPRGRRRRGGDDGGKYR